MHYPHRVGTLKSSSLFTYIQILPTGVSPPNALPGNTIASVQMIYITADAKHIPGLYGKKYSLSYVVLSDSNIFSEEEREYRLYIISGGFKIYKDVQPGKYEHKHDPKYKEYRFVWYLYNENGSTLNTGENAGYCVQSWHGICTIKIGSTVY